MRLGRNDDRALLMFDDCFCCYELEEIVVKGMGTQGGGRQWKQWSKKHAVSVMGDTAVRSVVGIV